MSSGVSRRWIYTFAHRARTVEVGPCVDEITARIDFHRVYGYWPADPTETVMWTPERVA